MTHEIQLSQPEANSLPHLICPFCSSENVEVTSRPKRQTLENGTVEITIGFGCADGHSWAWVLYDWKGRIFFSVEERRRSAEKASGGTDARPMTSAKNELVVAQPKARAKKAAKKGSPK